MVFINKILQIKQIFFRRKKALLISAALTLPSALLISIIFYSLNSKPYSISHLLKAAIILSCGFFWVFWWIVSRNKQNLKMISNRLLSSNKTLIAARIFILSFVILLITVGLFSPSEFPQINSLTKPNFRYLIEIEPDEGNPGNICIMEIKNSRGAKTILQNPGNWKRDFNGCEHFLPAGTSGKITFENIGPIDDEIEIVARSDPKAGVLFLTSEPGTKRVINLRSDEERNLSFVFNLGNILIKKITNWGLKAGYVLILLVYFRLIPAYFYKKLEDLLDIFSNGISNALRKQKHIIDAWRHLDSKEAAIISIAILLIVSVLLTVFLINQLAYWPLHNADEYRYWYTALNIYKGTFTTLNYHHSPPFYPISLLPAFYLFYPFGIYTFVKFLNALYITSAIIPAYLLLRKFTKRNISIIAITLLLLNPVQFNMPSLFMSENVFYPLFMWAVLFAFTNVWPTSQKNRIIECLILGVLLGLLILTRYIALALIPAFLFIWWLKPFEKERLPLLFSAKKALHLIIIFIPLLLIICGWVNAGMAEGLMAKDMLGLSIAGNPNPDQLSFGRLIMWIVFYSSFTILIAAPYLPILLASLSRFKLKDWQEDSNRWLIALAAIILFFLMACIRHSLRANYNYPTPSKLMGRYIFYFGPLFLITIFTSLGMPFKKMNRMKLIIFSSAMISAAYAFLLLGFIYLDGPLLFSSSSPDGFMVKTMGISFITLTLTNVIISSLLINKRRIALFTFMVTFLFGFFIYGNVKILQNRLDTPTQIINTQIYNLVQEFKTLLPEGLDKDQPPLTIFIPNESSLPRIALWKLTLIFNGFTDISMNKSNIAENDPANVLQAGNSNQLINLRELTEIEFLLSKNKKFSLSGKFFEYQIMPND